MTIDDKDIARREAGDLAEKDERYVWHALSRYTPTGGGGSAPASTMIVAEGEGALARMRLAQSVMRAAGLHAEAFADMEVARQWLLSDGEVAPH